MSAAAVARRTTPFVPTPPKGGFKPVAFKIVDNPLAEDAYAAPQRKRTSPYRDALVALASAKRGSVLRFESNSALTQIKAQAKKLSYKILVAENEGKLYVQIVDTGDDK